MSELWRWVDPRVNQVTRINLEQYLLGHGWTVKPFPQPQGVVFEEPMAAGQDPVVQIVPVNEKAKDFPKAVIEIITSLSAVEERHPVDILNDILHQVSQDSSTVNGIKVSEGAVSSV